MTNLQFSNVEVFKQCCMGANTPPTTRQASKFKNKKGIAYSVFKRRRNNKG